MRISVAVERSPCQFRVGFNGFIAHVEILGDVLKGLAKLSSCQDRGPGFSGVLGSGPTLALALVHEGVGELFDAIAQQVLSGHGCRFGFEGSPTEVGLAEAEGGFMAGAAVGSEVAQDLKDMGIVGVLVAGAGEAEFDRAFKACDNTAFASGNFDGLELVFANEDGIFYPVEEGIGLDRVVGEEVPAAQITVEEVARPGQG